MFSALGLREGWLYSQLAETERYLDPLLEGAQLFGLPLARVPEFAPALARWTDDLFPGETPADRRLRLAVCALSDIAWRDHPDVRAEESFRRLLQFPFIGLDHAERVVHRGGDPRPLCRQAPTTAGCTPAIGLLARAAAAARRSSAARSCWATVSRAAYRRSSTRRAPA